jgi:hypothetical protein
MIASAYRVIQQTGDRLVIAAPGSSLAGGWMGLVIAGPLLLILYLTSRTVARVYTAEKTPQEVAALVLRYRLFGLALVFVAMGFFWAVSYNSGSIELDRTNNLATMHSKMTAILPERSTSMPLTSVREAMLDAKPNARRIRLLAREGSDLAYPIWSDRSGQDAAVAVINDFLALPRTHGVNH